MPTPTQLEKFATDRGWTYRELAEAISRQTGIVVTLDTVRRFCNGIGRPKRLTAAAIEKYWDALPKAERAVRKPRHAEASS